jgi:FAD dependent oxidoreductase
VPDDGHSDAPFEVAFTWAGTFAESRDGLPYIGPTASPNVLVALGYGGNGITFSVMAAEILVMAAEILRDLCIGRPHDDAARCCSHAPACTAGSTPFAMKLMMVIASL